MRAWMLVALVACSSTQAVDDWTGPPVDTGTVDTGGDTSTPYVFEPPFAGAWQLAQVHCGGLNINPDTFALGDRLVVEADGGATFQGEFWLFLDDDTVEHAMGRANVEWTLDKELQFVGLLEWRDEPACGGRSLTTVWTPS